VTSSFVLNFPPRGGQGGVTSSFVLNFPPRGGQGGVTYSFFTSIFFLLHIDLLHIDLLPYSFYLAATKFICCSFIKHHDYTCLKKTVNNRLDGLFHINDEDVSDLPLMVIVY
jgi:hypothetical protein